MAACDQALLVERLCSLDGSLVTCRDAYGATSLHAAAAAGAGAAIGALLRHGADATFEDSKGRTPRDIALERNQERAAAQIDAMADAIDDGDFDECARLADAGNWPVDWCALSGDTALVAAARRGAPDAVSRLLACGATVDAVTDNDETPLAWFPAAVRSPKSNPIPPDCICMKSITLLLGPPGLSPPAHSARPRFLSLVFPLGGTKYACESKVVTPSKVDPNCVPTSVVVEKPTGEFGVNLDATGPVLLVLDLTGVIIFSSSLCVTSLAELQIRSLVSDVFSNMFVGGVKSDV